MNLGENGHAADAATSTVCEIHSSRTPSSGEPHVSGELSGSNCSIPSSQQCSASDSCVTSSRHPLYDPTDDAEGTDEVPSGSFLWQDDEQAPGAASTQLSPAPSDATPVSHAISHDDQIETIGNILADNLSVDTDDRLLVVAADTVATPTDSDSRGNIEQLLNDAASETGEPDEAIAAAACDSALSSADIPDPKSYKQATHTSNPFRCSWMKACDKEINSHESIGTWILVKLPKGRKAISCIWVFKTKRGKNGEILKHKARLCFRGDHQKIWY